MSAVGTDNFISNFFAHQLPHSQSEGQVYNEGRNCTGSEALVEGYISLATLAKTNIDLSV